MSWQSILLQPIHPNIINRLDTRKLEHGRKPWIRVISNAIVDGDTSLRDRYVLRSVYGVVGSANLPGAGISSIVVNQKGMLGGIREAQVSFRVFDLQEMEIIEKLFMVPGISVMLEWGWEGFQPPPIDLKSVSSMEEAQRLILKRSLGVRTDQELFSNQRTNSDQFAGHYDGMIGVITNFTKNSTDRGFECTFKIVSPNGVLSGTPVGAQKYNIVMHRTLKNTTSEDGGATPKKTEGTPLSDAEAVLYSIKYPGSAKGQDVRLISAPTVASLDAASAQSQEIYEFKFEGAFDKLKAKVPVDLSGNTRPWRDYSSIDRELDFSLDIGVFKATEGYAGPVIGDDILGEDQFNKINMGFTLPVRYQNIASGFSELDQVTIQSYVSWRFIEDVLISQVMMDHYSDRPSISVASVDITGPHPNPQYFASCQSRIIRNLPELRSADPTVCLLPGQIYGEDLEDEMEYLMNPDYRGDFDASREIFSFPLESFNQAPKFSVDGSRSSGYLRNIMVNVDFILSVYKPDGSQSVTEFMEALLDGISKACGNFWNFHVVANPNRPQLLEVVDEKTVPDKQAASRSYEFKLNTVDTKVKKFSNSSKLPQKVQSLAYIGARSTDVPGKENSVHVQDTAVFLGYSRGVKDLFGSRSKAAPTQTTPTNSPTPSPVATPVTPEADDISGLSEAERAEYISDRAEEDLFSNLPPRERWLNTYANLLYRNFATPEARSAAEEALKNYLVQDNEREAYIDEATSPSFLLPMDLDFSLDGISGIYMGNGFSVNTYSRGGPLPDRYKDKVAFQVTDVSHTIGDTWETSITGMMRMLDIRSNVRTGPKPSRPSFSGRTSTFTPSLFEGPVDGLSGPSAMLTSNASLDSLYPGLRPRVERIMDQLRNKGWEPQVVTVFRSLAEQLRKVEDGFSKVAFGPHNNVIGTKDSPQRASLALDIVDKRYLWAEGKPQEDQQMAAKFFIDLGKLFKEDGWTWGGDWRGMPSVWNNYLKMIYFTGQSSSNFSAGTSYAAASYRPNGWPAGYPVMGWDPAHVEIHRKDVSGRFAAKYEGLPSWSEAKQNSAKIYGRNF